MRLRSAAVAALVLVQAAPPAGTGKAATLAEIYGRTLGAASQCELVMKDRIAGTARLAAARLKAVAKDAAEDDAVGRQFAAASEAGAREVKSGMITCLQAETELGNLEHDLAVPR